ncbi:MAG: hypothetical protein ACYSUK_10170 [Planctomycetota bacterium]|jgi:hypothetical protein
MEEKPDFIDILIKLGGFLTFIVFAAALWFIRKDLRKQKKEKPNQPTQKQEKKPH